MIITGTQASMFAALRQNSHAPRSAARPEAAPAADATTVAISPEAMEKAAGSAQEAGGAAGPYRLSAPATPLSALVSDVYKMPDSLIREMEVRTQEEAAREEISKHYAYEHRYQTVGQVLVDGKLFAEVDDAGGYGSVGNIPGLSDATLDPRSRLEEIARAAQGSGKVEIRYADFVPGLGGWGGPAAPESMLPAFTARNIRDIFAEAIAANKQQRSGQPAPQETTGS